MATPTPSAEPKPDDPPAPAPPPPSRPPPPAPVPASAPSLVAYTYRYPAQPAVGIPLYGYNRQGLFALNPAHFLRRILAAAIFSILMAAIITFSVWLIFRPRTPQLSITSASLTSFNVSTSPPQLSADFLITLSAINPNTKMSAFYDNILAGVIYGPDIVIAEASLRPFHQPPRNSTSISARMATSMEYMEPEFLTTIGQERASGGAVGFELKMAAFARFQTGIWTTRWNLMRVHCEDVSISFLNASASDGKMVGPPKSCHVRL